MESIAERGYPRPQLYRSGWQSLNGEWDFALDPDANWTIHARSYGTAGLLSRSPLRPSPAPSSRPAFSGPAGIAARSPRRPLNLATGCCCTSAPSTTRQQCGATVAWRAAMKAGIRHSPSTSRRLSADDPELTIAVRAGDDPLDLAKPRGKQDWQRQPHSIWYPRTSGIWQTVWIEVVPPTRIDRLRWTPNLERWEIGLEAWVTAPVGPRCASMCTCTSVIPSSLTTSLP